MKHKGLDRTVRELLELYPGGFAVAPNSTVSKTILATSLLSAVATCHPIAPRDGGYLVVLMQKGE